MDNEILEAIDLAINGRFPDRSSYIRRAVIEKLKKDGYSVEDALALPPARTGKGGRPSHRKKYPGPTGAWSLNEGKSTKPARSQE
jgi:Arc/MetJ-type ribon-helix-helix transcriptional regulator